MVKYRVIYQNVIYRVLEIDGKPYPDYKENEIGVKKCKAMMCLLALNEDGELIHICDEAWRFQFVKEVE